MSKRAQKKHDKEKKNNEFKCSICYEKYNKELKKPMGMPCCGNSYCKECLQKVIPQE